jgi:hexosaminidase
MWGEWIPTVEDMEVMVFPRFSAYAETGWCSNSVKDFKSFKDRLQTMKKRWDNLGIKYAKEELSN